jgi:Na+/melibiose symporter-like transporter
MANMTSSDRAQYERPELSAADRSMRVGNRRPVIAFTAIGLVILAALVYATAWGINGWAHALVLGVIVLTVIGLIIAVSPTRRA